MDDRFTRVGQKCEAWERLYNLVRHLVQEGSGCAKADIISRSEDAMLCELVSRSSARVAGTVATQEAFLAAYGRIESELDVERMGALGRSLREQPEAGPADATAFDELVSVARDHHSVLPAEKRLWV